MIPSVQFSVMETTLERELISGEELFAMGDIGRCELVEGRIVPMSPTRREHSEIEGNIYFVLKAFVKPHALGHVGVGEAGIYTQRNPDTVRGADVFYISNERAARLSPRGFMDVAPELIVEVMSPDDRWSEVTDKIIEYIEIGVKVVLVVAPSKRKVFVYRSLINVQVLNAQDTLAIDEILPGFSVPVSALFEET